MCGRTSHSCNGGATRDSVMRSAAFSRVSGFGLMQESLRCIFDGMWNRPSHSSNGEVLGDFVMINLLKPTGYVMYQRI
jgi:hypothetical protein